MPLTVACLCPSGVTRVRARQPTVTCRAAGRSTWCIQCWSWPSWGLGQARNLLNLSRNPSNLFMGRWLSLHLLTWDVSRWLVLFVSVSFCLVCAAMRQQEALGPFPPARARRAAGVSTWCSSVGKRCGFGWLNIYSGGVTCCLLTGTHGGWLLFFFFSEQMLQTNLIVPKRCSFELFLAVLCFLTHVCHLHAQVFDLNHLPWSQLGSFCQGI